ncbi:MAG TPA: phosphatase PAP2 family protein [Steroidobacteraceae bacterium]|nr:phosphatase PAP2 family protein [Steroidobacteraceae bacterium]
MTRRIRIAAISLALLCAAGAYWWSLQGPTFLPADTAVFVAQVAPPPAKDSPQMRAEIDELLAIQAARTKAQREAARADRKKDIRQFYGPLGVAAASEGSLDPLRTFMERVEGDVSIYVRAAKHRFARPRPYVVEPRLKPCIGDVADNQSYPSGHSAYGYSVALVLADMVPERRTELLARADEFAHHRMTCGVHYASDIAAGRKAAEWLVVEFGKEAGYRAAESEAAGVLRAAIKLPPVPAK